MRPELYWVEGPWPGRLAVAPRPRGGDWLADELAAWRRAGVDVVVSALTADEASDLDLADEAVVSAAQGLTFLSFPIPDREVPVSRASALAFIEDLGRRLSEGQAVAIHCRQGIGRSALLAGGLFIRAGLSSEDASQRISRARGRLVPETPEQSRWLKTFAEAPIKTAPR